MDIDKEVKKLERKIAALKAKSLKIEANRKKTALNKVMAVVAKFGFESIQELLEIADTAAVATKTKKKRARITDTVRKSVVSMLKSGGKTVATVAKLHKVSTASVNSIKTKAGLIKSRKKAAPKRVAKKASTPRKKDSIRKAVNAKIPTASSAAPSPVQVAAV